MNPHDIFEKRSEYFLKPSSTVRGALVLFSALGALSLIAGATLLHDPARVWGSILLNVFFLFSIALGGVAFSGMQDVIGAVWCRPIKRIHEAFAAFIPVAVVVFLFFFACIAMNLFGATEVYSWIKDPESIAHFNGKNIWLTKNCMLLRDSIALLVILALSTWQICMGTRRDKAFVNGDKAKAQELGIKARDALRFWSAPILVCYALLYSLLAFDLLMSLAPTWFSTLWGGWLFAVMMQTLMAATLLFMFAFKNTALGQVYKRAQFHDVGKLMHGFTVFFAYLTYAHVLTYWYGNMPEETEYFLHRLQGPWLYLVIILPFLNFVLPLFVLIFKAAKWTAMVTIPVAIIILVSQWLVYVVVVVPQLGDGHHWRAPWLDLGLFAGFVGVFLMCYFAFAKRHPMLAVGDVILPEALHSAH